MSNRNLFTGLVRHENGVTELLVNMMQQKFFRDICLRWLLKDFIDCPRIIESLLNEIEAKDIWTQFITEKAGIPDIVIRSDNCHFLIENKIHVTTKLTSDQENGYKSIFDDNARYKVLLFIIPRGYKHVDQINSVRVELINTDIKIDVVYWDDLLSYLYKQEVGEISCSHKNALEQMARVIDNTTVYDTRLTSYETAMLYSPHQITEIYKRSSEIKDIFANHSNDKSSGQKWNEDEFGIGYFYPDRKSFIGLGPSVSNPDCFFAYSFESEKTVNGIRSELDETTGTYWNYCPIEIKELENLKKLDPKEKNEKIHNLIKSATNQLKSESVPHVIRDDGVLLKMEMDTCATYTLAEKIIKLCTQFVVSNRKLKFSHSQANHEGIGCYFDLENHSSVKRCFIGYGPNVSVEKNLYVSIESSVGKQAESHFFMIENWLCYPIEKSCLFGDDLKTQQEEFIKVATDAFNKLLNSIKDNNV